MALIGIAADRDCDIHVYNLSEVHYALRASYSFVTMEFAIAAQEDISKFTLCIHGGIETDTKKIKKLTKTRSYAQLFKLGECKLTTSSGIYDFRDSWRLDAVTNQCYEGPEPFNRISVRIADQQITYYGCQANIPEVTFSTQNIDSCTLVDVMRRNGQNFSEHELYVFRVGFFLKWPEELLHKGFKHFVCRVIKGTDPINYAIHTLSCPRETEIKLRGRTDIKNRIDRSCLYIDLSPFTERYKEENPESELKDIIDGYSDKSTSDLWIVTKKQDNFDTASELLAGASELTAQNVKYVLFSRTKIGSYLPYSEYHLKYRDNIRPLMGVSSIKPSYDGVTQLPVLWHLSPRTFNLKSWIKEVWKYSGALALILVICGPFLSDKDYVYWAFGGIILAYLFVLLIIELLENLR